MNLNVTFLPIIKRGESRDQKPPAVTGPYEWEPGQRFNPASRIDDLIKKAFGPTVRFGVRSSQDATLSMPTVTGVLYYDNGDTRLLGVSLTFPPKELRQNSDTRVRFTPSVPPNQQT